MGLSCASIKRTARSCSHVHARTLHLHHWTPLSLCLWMQVRLLKRAITDIRKIYKLLCATVVETWHGRSGASSTQPAAMSGNNSDAEEGSAASGSESDYGTWR